MSVQGSTLFSDPNGEEWMIVAAGGRVFATRVNSVAREIPLNGNTLTGDCSFTQTFDRLILWRGTDATPLVMQDFVTGWQSVTEQSSESGAGTGTQPIPNSTGAAFFQNRVFVPFVYTDKKDFVAVGDIGNYTRYAYPQNAFRFNDGSDDEIVDLAPFGRSSMVVFKEKSVRIVDGLTPDANGNYTSAFSDVVSVTHGLVAPRAWATVGRDLFYVSTTGITSLRLTEENKVKGVDLPLSAPLEKTWARIKWSLRDKIRVAYWDNKLYVAVPLDDARVVSDANLASGYYDASSLSSVAGLVEGRTYSFELGANDVSLDNDGEILTDSGFFIAGASTALLTGTGNLASGSYNGITGNRTITGLTIGTSYYWTKGANDLTLVNAGETLTDSGAFTAVAVNVALTGTPAAAVTATIEPEVSAVIHEIPFYDVNNAVLVYDFLTEAWAGADQTDGVTHVKEWLLPTIDGRRRLVALTEDGLLRLWEEGFEDEVVEDITYPWYDVQVLTAPLATDGLKVINSTVVYADVGSATNTPSTWGADTLANARANIYAGLASGDWNLSDATVEQLDWGFRVTSTVANAFPYLYYYNSVQATYYMVPSMRRERMGPFYFELFYDFYIKTQPVEMSVTTRGYACQDPDQKRYQNATLRLETLNPNYSVGATYDGVNETDSPLSDQTRDRTRYTDAATPAWVSSNVNDDHGNPWREDYSVTLGSGFNFGSGVNLSLHQSALLPATLSKRGVFAELTLTNSTGRCILNSVTLEAQPGDRTRTTKYS